MISIQNDIRVLDDFLPAALHEDIVDFFQGPLWCYGWKSNSKKEQVPNCHWNVLFAGGKKKEKEERCESELMESPFLAPIQEVWQLLKAGPLAGHEVVRVYANAHTYGTDGYVHTDSTDADYYSTICYVHPTWHYDWAGDLVFFDEGFAEIVRAIYARPGRIVTFHGNVPHCARPLSRDCKALRMSLVFKTRKAAE